MAAIDLVVDVDAADQTGNTALANLLSGASHAVTVVDDSTTPDGTADCYVIAESSKGVLPSSTYASLAAPIVTMDTGSWDDMSLATVANDNSATSYRFFDLLTHEITAGISPTEECQVIGSNKGMWGVPGGSASLAPGAVIFALHGGSATHTMGYVVDEGGDLVGGTPAPARRVCLAYIDSWLTDLTVNGETLLLQSIDWALGGAAEPAEGSATGSVTWTGTASGSAVHSGSVSGSTLWEGAATGSTDHGGASSGEVTWTGTASGARASQGSTSATVGWTGSASGSTTHAGSVAGAVVWTGTASGSAVDEPAGPLVNLPGVANTGGLQGAATVMTPVGTASVTTRPPATVTVTPPVVSAAATAQPVLAAVAVIPHPAAAAATTPHPPTTVDVTDTEE